MSRSRKTGRALAWLTLVAIATASGCAWRTPIDPTGQSLFAAPPPAAAAPACPPVCPPTCPPAVATCPPVVNAEPACPPLVTTVPTCPPAMAVPPPGGPPPVLRNEPAGQLPWDDVGVCLIPQSKAAPVGSEVILVAGVVGPDNYYRTNRRLEWSIASGGVGQFLAVGQSSAANWLLGDFTRPKVVSSTYAIGNTSRQSLRLNRGTPATNDDVDVLAGQGWISVTSPIEGTTHVTVMAPDVYPWNARTKTATIHWVNAQWQLPSPCIGSAGGRQTLTTVVTRPTDQTPCAGWLVRYEIADGPPAGFAPSGAQSIEVPTDSAGAATVEILQTQPGPGTNHVNIQIIRPGTLPGADGRQFVLGSGTAMVTWSAPSITLQKIGPAVGTLGATLTYQTTVSNPGDLPAQDIVVTEEVPEGASYVSSTPPAEQLGRRLQWRMGTLAPGANSAITLNYRAERTGTISSCATATAGNNLRATDCATTSVGQTPPSTTVAPGGPTSPYTPPPGGPLTPPAGGAPAAAGARPQIELDVTGPAEAEVGSKAEFTIRLATRGDATVNGLVIRVVHDAGLRHEADQGGQVQRILTQPLEPYRPIESPLVFSVLQPGRLCHTVQILDANKNVLAEKQTCFVARSAPGGPAGAAGGTGAAPPAGASTQPSALVTMSGPREKNVGEMAIFNILVTNSGSQPLTNVRIVNQWDAAVLPRQASEGRQIEGGAALYWVLPSIQPGQTEQFDIEYECLAPSYRSVQRTTVSSAEGARAYAEAAISIRPASSPQPTVAPPPGATPSGGAASSPSINIPGRQPERWREAPPAGENRASSDAAAPPPDTRSNPSTTVAPGGDSPAPWPPFSSAPYPPTSDGAAAALGAHASDGNTATNAGNARDGAAAGANSGGQAASEPAAGDNAGASIPPTAAETAGLSVEVSDLLDPIRVGTTAVYQIRVKNKGDSIQRLVKVTARLSDGLTAAPLGTSGPTQDMPQISGKTISFQPAPEIRSGETLVYKVRAQARQPGDAMIEVEVTSLQQTQPIRGDAATGVLP